MTPGAQRACRRAGARLDRINRMLPRAVDEQVGLLPARREQDMPGTTVALMLSFGLAVSAGLVWAAHCCLLNL